MTSFISELEAIKGKVDKREKLFYARFGVSNF
jgi:hypothetical protein